MQEKPHLVITMGDVNGIGTEVLLKGLSRPEPWECCRPIVLGDAAAYEAARPMAPDAPSAVPAASLEEARAVRDGVAVWNGGIPAPGVRFGVLDPAAGKAAAEWTIQAVKACQAGEVGGMVTCPISKECIQKAGYMYSGHTSLIAEMTNSPGYRMCLFADAMRVVHISEHVSLRDALDAVRKDRIVESVEVGYDALRRLGMASPRIAVAGLNPHAGEAGAFGREEIEEIAPAVEACQAKGIHCTGPYPPDTVFRRMEAGHADMVIAMYHDQGHIPMKLIAMDDGVNVTLGIPIVRTSVDHGTAFDIAGKGLAREHSFCAAVRLAARLAGLEPAEAAS